MEAIVLAGGFGTRLREVVADVPKPMAPVCGRPFLEILLTAFARKGVSRVVLSLGFMAEKITQHFGKSFSGMEIDYVVEEQPLGTGGGVRLALSRCDQEAALIVNGDTFLDLDLAQLEHVWLQQRIPIIVGREVSDTARYGRLIVRGNHAVAFADKGISGPGLINAGCYVFPRQLLDAFPLNTPFSLENDFLKQAVSNREFGVLVTQGLFIDIGVPEDYLRAQTDLSAYAA